MNRHLRFGLLGFLGVFFLPLAAGASPQDQTHAINDESLRGYAAAII